MRSGSSVIGLCVLLVAGAACGHGAAAATVQILHSFCKAPQCGDGEPISAVSRDAAGDLFGVAGGGATNHGMVYELVPQPGRREWKYNIIHLFCEQNGCPDGGSPVGSRLVVDVNGNVYGTTADGGTADGGTVFELSPDGSGGWAYSVVYNFCSAKNCHDGLTPVGNLTYEGAQAGLLYNGRARLYGATTAGGGHFSGAAFALRPRVGQPWYENVVYAFCAHDVKTCPDGSAPSAGLTMDAAGHLFGVTIAGGATAQGVVFKLAPPPSRHAGSWTETVLHSFCSLSKCADGQLTRSEVAADSAGDIFGTTYFGGDGAYCPYYDQTGCGVLYEVTSGGAYSVLYVSCSEPDCADGSRFSNSGGMTADASGNVFGTVADGGPDGQGYLFELSGGTLLTLHDFCARSGCRDGASPFAGPTLDSSGHIFGTAGGGKFSGGTAYELLP